MQNDTTGKWRVAIIGRGRLGTAVSQALAALKVEYIFLSIEDGFDISKPVSFDGLGEFDAVVEATDIFTQNKATATNFFTNSTRHINTAALAAGIPKHILITIANATDPRLSGNGYYSGKAAQENTALRYNKNMTVIHSTLWYEFARQNINRMRIGPFAIVPQMKVQPVSLDALAKVIAECCIDIRKNTTYTVCGPNIMTLWSMTRSLPRKGCLPIPVPVPGAAGKAFREGVLIPDADTTEVVGPAFSEWLNTQK